MNRTEQKSPVGQGAPPVGSTGAIARRVDVYRVLDVVLSLAALLFLAPIFLFVAVVVRLQDGGSALFAHERIGQGARTFKCLKFRSMRPDSDARLHQLLASDPQARIEWARDHKLRSDPRITPLGGFLRRSSLDELPQFLNVLRGEMSLVGPRPIVEAEVARYGRYFACYCANKPGITGLWQISGRNDVGYRRRVAMDVIYARRRTVCLYLWILMATAPAVLLRRGAS
jgi:exopolysaccharide production protein ExoY